MPIPKPAPGESDSGFMKRCMGDSVMTREYTDKEQRLAVCLSQIRGTEEKRRLPGPRARLLATRLDRLIALQEPAVKRKIFREKQRVLKLAKSRFVSGSRLSENEKHSHYMNIRIVLLSNYLKIAKLVSVYIKKQIQTKKADFLSSDRLYKEITAKYVSEVLPKRARLISDTSFNDIERVIGLGLADPEMNNAMIAKELIKVGTEINKQRSEVISITETHTAAQYTSIEIARDTEREAELKLFKQWVPVQDDRTRDTHAEMEAHPAIPLDDLFDVGGERLEFPGDPSGSAENTINCRCVLVYVAEE